MLLLQCPQASLRTDYQYNPAGQRIRKVTRDKSAATVNPVTGTSWSGPEGPYEPALRRNKVTYYVRDANEQVIAIYEEQVFGHDEGQGNFAGTGDADGDLIADWMDNAPAVPNPTQDDFDHDGIADACDWCITIPNGPETEIALPQNGLPPACLPGGCTFPGDGFFGGRNLRLAEWPIYGTGAHGRFATAKPKNLARVAPQGLPASVPETFTRILKQKEYELSDHLGNVRVTFSDVKQLTGAPNAPPYKVDLQTYANYYPFGMMQPMRSYPDPGAAAPGPGAGTTYRYGYNGKEMDNEWYGDAGTGLSGVGNSYDYGFRIYNPRYARFLSVDPLTDEYPGWSPYPFAMNRPIDGIDLDGAEWYKQTTKFSNGWQIVELKLKVQVVRQKDQQEIVEDIMKSTQISFASLFSAKDHENKVVYNATLEYTYANEIDNEQKTIFVDFIKDPTGEVSEDGFTSGMGWINKNLILIYLKDKHFNIYSYAPNLSLEGMPNFDPIRNRIFEYELGIEFYGLVLCHEFGHSGNLYHFNDDPRNPLPSLKTEFEIAKSKGDEVYNSILKNLMLSGPENSIYVVPVREIINLNLSQIKFLSGYIDSVNPPMIGKSLSETERNVVTSSPNDLISPTIDEQAPYIHTPY